MAVKGSFKPLKQEIPEPPRRPPFGNLNPESPIVARVVALQEQIDILGKELSQLINRLAAAVGTDPHPAPAPAHPDVPAGTSSLAEALSGLTSQICDYTAAVKGIQEILEV